MPPFATEQEAFWAGTFGDAYIDRNVGEEQVTSNVVMFDRALREAVDVSSVLELGPNVGMNLQALRRLLPDAALAGVEINPTAAAGLRSRGEVEVHETSIVGWTPPRRYDLAFTKGVLIHINPDALPGVYDALVSASSRYVLIAEYYNPSPMNIPYRGHDNRLFKRDFAGEIMDRHPTLDLIDYGFVYHRDPAFPQDDLTWFLMEKTR